MIPDPIRVGGFFSGIGAHISACERLKDRANFKYVFECEWDRQTSEAHDVLHGFEVPTSATSPRSTT